MEGAAFTRSTRLDGSRSSVEMAQRIVPASRTRRVSSRVSTHSMATMPCSTRKSGRVPSLRQLLGVWHMSLTTTPARSTPSDCMSAAHTP